MDEIDDELAFRCCDAGVREGLELVGMQMQGLANQEGRFSDRIRGAVRERKLGLDEAADRIADEIEQREKLGTAYFGAFWRGAAARCLFQSFCHQDRVQRAAASSSRASASTQPVPVALSSFFQNGALVLR